MSSPAGKERRSLPAVRSPVSPYKQPQPNPKLTEAQKSASRSVSREASNSSWLDVSLPDISTLAGPEGPGAQRSPSREHNAQERKAVEVWMKSAESGHAESQNNLGISYYRGAGVPKDERQAVVWWSQAAQQGYAEAQYNLATCMMNGYGTERNEESAIALFGAAADQEHLDSMCMMASFFADGAFGVEKDLDKAVAMYEKAAAAGSEEAEYKLMVIEDLKTREHELHSLSNKISKINDGFIQLQLERAAHEEVTHAYKGAGFFLSNMKSEVPVRARIEMAQKAEKEIKHLRSELQNRDQLLEETLSAKAAKEMEVQDLEQMVVELEREKAKQQQEIEELEKAKEQLIKDKQKQRAHVEELLAENTELRTVAEWHKNQRVDALKQSLSAVVKTTISEQNESEKKLKAEIQKLRARLNQSYDGGAVAVDLDSEEHASLFLKRIRRDIFIQEALLKEILAQMRGDEVEEQIEFLREVMGQADMSERFLASAMDQVLDHVSESNVVGDDDALNLRQCLHRILNSMGEIKSKSGWEVQKIRNENDRLREEILEMTEKLGVLTSEGTALDESDQRMVEQVKQQVEAMEAQARENEAKLAEAVAQGHVVEGVQEDLVKVQEAVKLLKHEVRRSSSAFTPDQQGQSRDLAILEELRKQHEEKEEQAKIQAAARRERRMSRVSSSGIQNEQQAVVEAGTSPRTTEKHLISMATSPIAGVMEAGGEDFAGGFRSRRHAGARGQRGKSGESQRQLVAPQAQLGPEAMQELMDAMAGMREALEEKMEQMVDAVAQVAASEQRSGADSPPPIGSGDGQPARKEADDVVSDHGKALEKLQRKVGRILDILIAEQDGFEQGQSDMLSPLRGHTASSARDSVEGPPASGISGGIAEETAVQEAEASAPASPVGVDEGRHKPLTRRASMASRRSLTSQASSRELVTAMSMGGGGGDSSQLLNNIMEQINGLVKLTKQSKVEELNKMKREVQSEMTEKSLRIQVLEAENKALTIDLEKKELELKVAMQEKDKAISELHAAQRDFKEKLMNEQITMDEKIKAAQEEAQNALDDRDRLMEEAQETIKQKEKDMERKKEVSMQVMAEMQEKNVEVLKDLMEGFAPKVALHLSVVRSSEEEQGQGKGGGMSEEDLAALRNMIGDARREGREEREELQQQVRDLAEELRARDKKQRRAGVDARQAPSLSRAGSVEEAANIPLPPPTPELAGGAEAGGAWPLDPEGMDAVKQDLHFAVAGAVRRVMDQHKGGVVLLNLPDHNKPAGFFHGDGAGLLQKNMEEQRRLNAELRGAMEAMSGRMEKLEIKMEGSVQPESPAQGAPSERKLTYATSPARDPLQKPSHKLLYAVKGPGGRQVGVESRMLHGLEKDQLREGVDEMRSLLQSWYRSFTLVSRLENAFELT